jgi:hypothetical protein
LPFVSKKGDDDDDCCCDVFVLGKMNSANVAVVLSFLFVCRSARVVIDMIIGSSGAVVVAAIDLPHK